MYKNVGNVSAFGAMRKSISIRQIAESSGQEKLDLILGAIMNLLFFFSINIFFL